MDALGLSRYWLYLASERHLSAWRKNTCLLSSIAHLPWCSCRWMFADVSLKVTKTIFWKRKRLICKYAMEALMGQLSLWIDQRHAAQQRLTRSRQIICINQGKWWKVQLVLECRRKAGSQGPYRQASRHRCPLAPIRQAGTRARLAAWQWSPKWRLTSLHHSLSATDQASRSFSVGSSGYFCRALTTECIYQIIIKL